MTCTIISNGAELQLACKNENEPPYQNMKFELFQIISMLYARGYDTFYLNCEYGIPLWSAEIICSLKETHPVSLHIVVPYEEQTTNWTEEQRNRYYHIHAQADSVSLINTQYHPACYQEADSFMIGHSDLLYVFGKPEECLEAVNIARNAGVTIEFV